LRFGHRHQGDGFGISSGARGGSRYALVDGVEIGSDGHGKETL
jgi:hypothetical protein